ncbi:MAG: type II toxin-antitoxin system VapC family toxin [Candidatus Moranbacteria bacterium]|nr:type II toxin-antitoxin system VapC family toxin [Candidatus Moranbacteria bacterium]
MKVIDSSVWIAFFHEKDSLHQRARKLLGGIAFPIAVTEYVIMETCTVLSAKSSKKIANMFLAEIVDNEDVRILFSAEDLFWETVRRFERSSGKNLSFVDVSLVCLSDQYQIVTFDEKLKKVIKGLKINK